MIKSNLAENIKKYRKKESLTQVELAEKLDISKHSVISYEKGMTFPSSDILEKMMDLFGVTPNELFFPMNIRNKEITDKEAKIRELEVYRENVLNTVKEIEESASYIEYEQPVFDQEGNIVEYRDIVISSAEQARGVLMDAIDLKNLDTDFLIEIFNMKIYEELKNLTEFD
ncbi:helix-turn-helix transcriptional regulator [Enterococcus rivorum]|uniref:HTH cro/C1-type domain-containing protein n=1 Tax=Enterococcus rivorum TaxID=762845 RepID=A0A1E5KTF2_9ENTE|nr:helix-turn-helix transcriptional regulator [Enterococcus rivorum]MBP2100747.1 transcriptional regulator with XRE-family HTH domain [Enterococcus rivorum]OEH81133.1 hypothetical protein BCR26_17570 [Enterococcus rivorum]